ncbi:hypothetical protein FACS1894217_08400 [Clostridia bacterium]|nr:hypothetical protein FACS1894217_08400 [Clostridia bacterium]
MKVQRKPFTVREIAAACGGVFYGDFAILDKTVDSIATILKNISGNACCFVASMRKAVTDAEYMKKLIDEAYAKGALCVVSDLALSTSKPYIKVSSMRWKAGVLHSIGLLWTRSCVIPTISITGSNGKTCVTDMVDEVLKQKLTTSKIKVWTEQPDNPVFLWHDKHDVAVVETATGSGWSNQRNGELLRPDVVVITMIGTAHMGHYKIQSRDSVLEAKAKLLDYLSPAGIAYLNGDDDKLTTLALSPPQTIKWFGLNKKHDYYATISEVAMTGSKCKFVRKSDGLSLSLTIPVPGNHMVYNALPAFAIGLDFGIELDSIKYALEHFSAPKSRTNVIETDFLTIIEDCHNAAPESCRVAIDVVANSEKRKVFCFGGMLELGENSLSLHEDVAKYAAERVDVALFSGEFADAMKSAFIETASQGKSALAFDDRDKLMLDLWPLIQKDDVILVKASGGVAFSPIAERLKLFADNSPPPSHSNNICIVDQDGDVLFDKKADAREYPASNTKILTCIMALEKLALDDRIEVPETLKRDTNVLEPYETFALMDALYLLMLESSNGMALTIADNIAGSTEAFVKQMNKFAELLGVESPSFCSPAGLGSRAKERVSPKEMLKIMSYAIKNKTFRQIISTPSKTIYSSKKRFDLVNTNELVISDNPQYYSLCGGGKTGTWINKKEGKEIGRVYSLVSFSQKGDTTLLMSQMSDFATKNDGSRRFKEAAAMYEWAFANYEKLKKQPWEDKT